MTPERIAVSAIQSELELGGTIAVDTYAIIIVLNIGTDIHFAWESLL